YPLGDLRLGNSAEGRAHRQPDGARITDLPMHARTGRRPRAADAPGAPSVGRAAARAAPGRAGPWFHAKTSARARASDSSATLAARGTDPAYTLPDRCHAADTKPRATRRCMSISPYCRFRRRASWRGL